jgi:cytochrome c-type biogenesis protein CcmH/NrfG
MAAALEAVPDVSVTAPVALAPRPRPRLRLSLVAAAAGLAAAVALAGWLALRPHPRAAALAPALDAAPAAADLEIEPPAASGADGLTIARLLELRRKDPNDAGVAFALGHRYFSRLWWQDGMQAYQAAVRLDPSLSKNPTLIKDLVRALVSDGFHGRAEAFLRAEVGADALPYLDAAAASADGSINVRNRARALAAELRRP